MSRKQSTQREKERFAKSLSETESKLETKRFKELKRKLADLAVARRPIGDPLESTPTDKSSRFPCYPLFCYASGLGLAPAVSHEFRPIPSLIPVYTHRWRRAVASGVDLGLEIDQNLLVLVTPSTCLTKCLNEIYFYLTSFGQSRDHLRNRDQGGGQALSLS